MVEAESPSLLLARLVQESFHLAAEVVQLVFLQRMMQWLTPDTYLTCETACNVLRLGASKVVSDICSLVRCRLASVWPLNLRVDCLPNEVLKLKQWHDWPRLSMVSLKEVEL